jgi:hypothetical protein
MVIHVCSFEGEYSGQSHQAQLAYLVLPSFLTGHEELSYKWFLLVLTTARLEKETYLWNKKETYL